MSTCCKKSFWLCVFSSILGFIVNYMDMANNADQFMF